MDEGLRPKSYPTYNETIEAMGSPALAVSFRFLPVMRCFLRHIPHYTDLTAAGLPAAIVLIVRQILVAIRFAAQIV